MQIEAMQTPKLSDVRRMFQHYQDRYEKEQQEETSTAYRVFGNQEHKTTRDYKDKGDKRKVKCFICGKLGHKAVDCWHKSHRYKNKIEEEYLPHQTKYS